MNLQELIAKGASEAEIRAAGGNDADVAMAALVAKNLENAEVQLTPEVKALIEEAKAANTIIRKEIVDTGAGLEEKIAKLDFATESEQRKHASLSGSEQKKYEKSLKSGYFYKGIVEGDHAILKALTSTTDGGNFLIPSDTIAQISELAEEFGVARQECDVIKTSTPSMSLPVGGDVTVAWTDETVAGTPSNPVVTTITLNIKKLMTLVTVPNELLNDSLVNLADYINKKIAKAMTKEEDTQLFVGTTPFTGLATIAGAGEVVMAATKTSYSDVTYQNIVDTKAACPASVQKSAKWYTGEEGLASLEGLVDGNGRPLLTDAVDGTGYKVLGRPLVVSEAYAHATQVAKAWLVFGDLKQSTKLGVHVDLEVSASKEVEFKNDQIVIRGVERVGIAHVLPAAVSRLKTAAV